MTSALTPVREAAQAAPLDRRAVAAIVAAIHPGATVVDVVPLTGGLGAVLNTVVVRRADGAVARFVLRGLLTEYGHDAAMLRREAATHRAVAASGRVPVPEVLWTDPDGVVLGRPTMAMTFVDGAPLLGALRDPAAAAAAAACLAAIHDLPPAAFGHAPRLTTAAAYRPFVRVDRSDLVDVPRLLAALDRTGARIGTMAPVVCHGDFHAGNVLWHGGAVSGVVDWPWALVGGRGLDESVLWMDTALAWGRRTAATVRGAYDAATGGVDTHRAFFDLLALAVTVDIVDDLLPAYRATGVADLTLDVLRERFVTLTAGALARAA